MWKKRKNNKGFTLVEMVVTFALTGVFMVAAIGVLVSFTRIQGRVTSFSKVQMASELLAQTIISQVEAAYKGEDDKAVMIHGDGQGISFWNRKGKPLVIQSDGKGYLMEMGAGEGGYKKEHYMGTVITQLTFEQEYLDDIPSNRIRLTLQMTHRSSGITYTAEKIFLCYNLEGLDIGTYG
jgi:prepilin-type N-terminal cleavage/methylation domain-containing protein